ncbi:hypothetical protein GCM10009801_33890 [Streptomyces albiaxialis]|uniref:Uncharacterized protein n=1 Tax=Streptomyces albiaxialis TaxID=329523 RepID=A0ABN2W2K2_9ACTN
MGGCACQPCAFAQTSQAQQSEGRGEGLPPFRGAQISEAQQSEGRGKSLPPFRGAQTSQARQRGAAEVPRQGRGRRHGVKGMKAEVKRYEGVSSSS